MFVSRSMTQKVVTINKDADILEAKELMEQHQIRHLPVVEPDGLLIGIITDRDLRSALPSTFYKKDKAQTKKAAAQSIKVNALTTRLYEIKHLDKSGMAAAEKRHLRKEARSLREQRRQLNGGVYLSVGAIILVVVLLIILL